MASAVCETSPSPSALERAPRPSPPRKIAAVPSSRRRAGDSGVFPGFLLVFIRVSRLLFYLVNLQLALHPNIFPKYVQNNSLGWRYACPREQIACLRRPRALSIRSSRTSTKKYH